MSNWTLNVTWSSTNLFQSCFIELGLFIGPKILEQNKSHVVVDLTKQNHFKKIFVPSIFFETTYPFSLGSGGHGGKKVIRSIFAISDHFQKTFFADPSQNIALSCPWVTKCSSWNLTCWISQSFYMDFSKLLHGIVEIDTWISPFCYMDSSHLICGFL